jgi:hypothetical protein
VTFLPVSTTFNTHPDSNANVNIAVEVAYSDFRRVDGVLIPFEMEKKVNGINELSVSITGVFFNAALAASEFELNAAENGRD